MAQRFEERARRLGLTRAQWALIAALFRREGSSQATLAEHLEITPISLGRLVDRMEKAGWVERRGEPADRRAYRLYLTERAHRLRPQLRALTDHVQIHALRALDIRNRSDFIAQLRLGARDPGCRSDPACLPACPQERALGRPATRTQSP